MVQTEFSPYRSTFMPTAFGLTLLVCLFACPSFAEIHVAVHANWDPDLTDTTPASCDNPGPVANPHFHFVAAYKYPVMSVSVDWVKVEEQPEQHVPSQVQYNNPSGSTVPPPACAQQQQYILTVKIYSTTTGQQVRERTEQNLTGDHLFTWDGTTTGGLPAEKGLYTFD